MKVDYTLDGFVGGPLSGDTLEGSVAFKVSREDSQFPNPLSAIGEPGDIRELFLQGRLNWQPNDALTLRATGYIIDVNAPGIFEEEYLPNDRDLYDASYGPFNGGRTIGRFELLQESPKRTDERDYVFGLAATYELASGRIDAAVSYAREEEDSRGNDLDFTALPTAAGASIFEQDVWNAEVRYTSPASERFEYLFGGSVYFEREELLIGTLVGSGTLADYAYAPPQSRNSRDFAIFGSATFGLGIEGLSLTTGLRYDNAYRKTDQVAGTLNFGPLGDAVFQELSFDDTFEAFLPRFALTYRPTDQWTVFAGAARGYILGGFNLTIAQEAVADDVVRYGSESVWSYEIGVKHSFADGRGYINGAAFLIEADNWQEIRTITNEQGQVQSSAFIASDAAIESKGFEVELAYNLLENLTLNASIGYTDADYTRLFIDSQTNLAGNLVKLVPEYDANLALRYAHSTGFFIRSEISALGRTALDERNRFSRDPVQVLGIQAGYEADGWSIRAFAENLTDERYQSGAGFDNFAFGFDGNFYSVYDTPRVIGLETKVRF
ncbi:TonB-dependent receptor [Porphyrobacter sp. HT-58-2]|uniref:TonB-dependent receptor n=1 Tax=Porphyrobacter sp. HT-58-2 TaxID=2023229 RepID=UPI00155970DD|nr:TonB-dependent receptor [Porphyrobacter sp. HT-58-2]